MREFMSMPVRLQVDLLYHEGVYLGKRFEEDRSVLLYQIEGFYIEIGYRSYRLFIHSIRASETIDILEPYLDQIRIYDPDG